jgi:hypothetical protein
MSKRDDFLNDATPAAWMGHFLAAHRRDVPRGSAKKAYDRRLRLYAAAECRRVWPLLIHEDLRKAVEGAEAFADGTISKTDLVAARHRTFPFVEGSNETRPSAAVAAVACADLNLHWVADLVRRAIAEAPPPVHRTVEETNSESVRLIRCVFGNLFRSSSFDPRWRTADTVGLARGIYEDRAFDRLPLLADALMDAGCADEQVLGHCKSEGPHVRGCWVVDLILGKE